MKPPLGEAFLMFVILRLMDVPDVSRRHIHNAKYQFSINFGNLDLRAIAMIFISN